MGRGHRHVPERDLPFPLSVPSWGWDRTSPPVPLRGAPAADPFLRLSGSWLGPE